jgi:molecular chaperone DnaK
MEKLIAENKAKLSEATAKAVQDGITEVHNIKASEDGDAIKAAMEKLEKASHAAAAELYRSASPEAGAPGAGPAAGGPTADKDGEKKGGKDDVVDAEFRPS